MGNKILHHKLILLLLLLTLNICSVVFGYSWDAPVEVPKNATAEEVEKIENFNKEINLAKEAPDRDSKVEHMKKALTCRPEDPDNIRIEYKIAVMLSQYWNPENPQPMRRKEALTIYEKIVNTYDHIQYYNKRPENSIGHPGIMVPRAAVHAAGLANILYVDELRARKYAEKAMKCLQETYEKRKSDILSEPRPIEKTEVDKDVPTAFGGPLVGRKFENQLKYWEQRQKDAKEGNVFGNFEMLIAKAAVRQYGYSFGRSQGFADVVSAMSSIVRDYPDTPMSKIASEYIELGKEKVLNDLHSEILEESIANLESPSTSTNSKPIVSEKDLAPAEIFIPTASIALKHGNPFVLDLSSREFVFGIPLENKIDSRQIYNHLTKVSKGDIAWDGAIVTVRKTKALTIRQESSRPLQSTSAKWVSRYKLPEKVELPYSTMLIADKNLHYLITIHKIDSDGIRITYRKLNADEAKHCLPTKKKKE